MLKTYSACSPESKRPTAAASTAMHALLVLRKRGGRDGRIGEAHPSLEALERVRLLLVRMERHLEPVGDELRIGPFVDAREARVDGGQRRQRPAESLAVTRAGERSDRRRVDPAAQEHRVLAREAARHGLVEQVDEAFLDLRVGDRSSLEEPLGASSTARR